MKETKFIEQNKDKWAEFESLLASNQRDPERLNDLFIQITDDLSYARTFYPNRSVRMYLNSLAQRVFHNVYRGKRVPAGRFRKFWALDMPQVMWEARWALLLAFSIFVLAFTIGVVSSILNPDFARVVLSDEYVEMTLANIENNDPMAVYKDSGPLGMSVGIAANNLFVALRTAIFGVLASIGTVFMLLYNGIMVGAFQYFFIERGLFWESFLTIWIHGTLEISAIIIAGAAGLVAGSGLLFPGTYRRVQAFQISMRRGLKIFIGLVPVFILAAVFEGFLTRYTQTPDAIRGLFILCSLFFVLWYFVWLPWHLARRGVFDGREQGKELPPDRADAIDFKTIKNAGEILSDTFTMLRRHPRTTLFGLLGATVLLLIPAFVLSPAQPADTFIFTGSWLGVLDGVDNMMGTEEMPWLFYAQIIVFVLIATAALRAARQEMPDDIREVYGTGNWVLGTLILIIPMPFFLWVFRLDANMMTWLLIWFTYPFLALWCAVLMFETQNPFTALGRTFSLIRWGEAILLGFLVSSLGVLLYWFLDSEIWDIILRFFSWMVPSGEGNMRNFVTIATAVAASIVTYFMFLALILGGVLQYFSGREVADAAQLREGIEKIGTARQIRGLARE
ncbi:MAG: stage II sporulation protein M [Saprospiraceae bacterium]|nr:stage II sporulation protein M [Saprospiraceae bacterium]